MGYRVGYSTLGEDVHPFDDLLFGGVRMAVPVRNHLFSFFDDCNGPGDCFESVSVFLFDLPEVADGRGDLGELASFPLEEFEFLSVHRMFPFSCLFLLCLVGFCIRWRGCRGRVSGVLRWFRVGPVRCRSRFGICGCGGGLGGWLFVPVLVGAWGGSRSSVLPTPTPWACTVATLATGGPWGRKG